MFSQLRSSQTAFINCFPVSLVSQRKLQIFCVQPHVYNFQFLWENYSNKVRMILLFNLLIHTSYFIFCFQFESIEQEYYILIMYDLTHYDQPLIFMHVCSTHCYFTRLNPKRISPFQFCLPAMLGMHRNPKKKRFFEIQQVILEGRTNRQCHHGPV